MRSLRHFYERWKSFFLVDGLMYLVFVVTLVILFVFFR